MQRVGFLILADEMLRRSGARGIEVKYWSDTERGSMTIERSGIDCKRKEEKRLNGSLEKERSV